MANQKKSEPAPPKEDPKLADKAVERLAGGLVASLAKQFEQKA